METPVEREWELAIDPETVRMFALKARVLSAAVSSDGGHEIEIDGNSRDSHRHDGLAEEEEDDLTEEELRELINDLNEDEAADLVALAWIGRGDYEASEWATAVGEARERGRAKTASYLLGMPMLADWLEDGLEALGA